DRFRRMRSVIDHSVTIGGEPRLEAFLEGVARMIRPDGDGGHTRTIPIVACRVKRPYISGKGERSRDGGGAGDRKRKWFERRPLGAAGPEPRHIHRSLPAPKLLH